jgi:hypothetical protein
MNPRRFALIFFALSALFTIGCSVFGCSIFGSTDPQGSASGNCLSAYAAAAARGDTFASLNCELTSQALGSAGYTLVEVEAGSCPLTGEGEPCSDCVVAACCPEAVACLASSDAGDVGCGAFSTCVRQGCAAACGGTDGGHDGGMP